MRPLAFVDLETTGATATSDRITEIGIVEVYADGTVREWQQLVNPGTRIPPFIEQLTGISNEMVADAPTFAAVAAETLRRLEGRLFIAHNARFDYGFLKNEFKRLGVTFRAPVLCTVKLSRTLYPQFHRHNLDSLIERHGLQADARHRALADAQLIHQFWQKIHVDRSSDEIEAALSKLNARPSLPPHLDASLIDDLPDTPGVYLFYGEKSDSGDLPLYIGKAKEIRQRCEDYMAVHGRPPRSILMQNHGLIVLSSSTKEALSACKMWVKAATILMNAAMLGGVNYLTPEQAARIEHRPDEEYRRRILAKE